MPVNRILLEHYVNEEGGLKCGHVLELSGPPGSPREVIMLDFVRNTVTSGNDAIFVGL